MEYIHRYNNQICIEAGWLYNTSKVISQHDYKNLKRYNKIEVIRRGCKGTPALVNYDSLPNDIRTKIESMHPEVKNADNYNPLEDIIVIDQNAVKYYYDYTLENGEKLPKRNIDQYIAEASIYNAIEILSREIILKKKALKSKKGDTWQKIADYVHLLDRNKHPHKLSSNGRRLKGIDDEGRSFRRYKKLGYEGLIHRNFLNNNSQKINEKAKLWVLSRWADQFDRCANINQLWLEYNQKAKTNDWKVIESETPLKNYLYSEEIKSLWYGHRHGELKSKEKFSYQQSTKMPSMRDSLWYSDGTKLNYYYLDANGKIKTCQVYEVMDAYSEVLLGYHISDTEDYKAQYSAYKMAVQVSEHKPYQIGFDGQGGHAKLKSGNFLTKLSRLAVRTEPYNGKSKTIELAFGRFQQQFLKRDWFFTGQNIQAKKEESKANMEFILANKSNLPSLEDIKLTYAKRRKEWNQAPHPKTKQPRIETYLNSINKETPKIDLWEMVDIFWVQREKPVTCNAFGISFTENKEKHTYMVYSDENMPDISWLSKNIDKKFTIKYDPEDLSMIYLYEDTPLGLKFVSEAKPKVEIHRGKQEQEAWEAEWITKVRKANQDLRIARRDEMEEILEAHGRTAAQRGLNTPAIKGVESSRRAKKSNKREAVAEIGEHMKEISNADIIEEEYNHYNQY
jgi:hypothetical protein